MKIAELNDTLMDFAAENKDRWNEIDGIQGDGDLGTTVFLGARAICNHTSGITSLSDWFITGGKAFRREAPSTMGILIASSMIKAGKYMENLSKETLSLKDWALLQKAMIDEIQHRGGAQLGDKTVLDVLIPAVKAFEAEVNKEESVQHVLKEVVRVAKQAAEQTKEMKSKIGRSSWVGDKNQHVVDGGALVCYQIYQLFYQSIADEVME